MEYAVPRVPAFLEGVHCQTHLANLHREALAHAEPGGLYLEFGVGHGTLLRMLRELIPDEQRIYGFDSFRGLPEPWRGHPVGSFAVGAVGRALEKCLRNVEIVVGLFRDTVRPFAEGHAGERISYMHIDCDLGSSTIQVLNGLDQLIKPGTVIVFDELFGYEGWAGEEYGALVSWLMDQDRSCRWIVRDEHWRAGLVVTR